MVRCQHDKGAIEADTLVDEVEELGENSIELQNLVVNLPAVRAEGRV